MTVQRSQSTMHTVAGQVVGESLSRDVRFQVSSMKLKEFQIAAGSLPRVYVYKEY